MFLRGSLVQYQKRVLFPEHAHYILIKIFNVFIICTPLLNLLANYRKWLFYAGLFWALLIRTWLFHLKFKFKVVLFNKSSPLNTFTGNRSIRRRLAMKLNISYLSLYWTKSHQFFESTLPEQLFESKKNQETIKKSENLRDIYKIGPIHQNYACPDPISWDNSFKFCQFWYQLHF
jgi:hypothetical protein